MSREDRLQHVEAWEEATCESCGRLFPRRQHYEKKCLLCFKDSQEYNVLQGDLAFMWMQERLAESQEQLKQEKVRSAAAVEVLQALDKLKHRAQRLLRKKRAAEQRALAAQKRAEEAEQTLKSERRRADPVRFDKAFLRALVSLTHPDKHEGSKKATEVTKRLLSMRSDR